MRGPGPHGHAVVDTWAEPANQLVASGVRQVLVIAEDAGRAGVVLPLDVVTLHRATREGGRVPHHFHVVVVDVGEANVGRGTWG